MTKEQQELYQALRQFQASAAHGPVMKFLRHQAYEGVSPFVEGNYDPYRAAVIDGKQQLFRALLEQLDCAAQMAAIEGETVEGDTHEG